MKFAHLSLILSCSWAYFLPE